MLARVPDIEPGMRLRSHAGAELVEVDGWEPVVSRFPGKDRIRVRCGGDSFVCDRGALFEVWRDR